MQIHFIIKKALDRILFALIASFLAWGVSASKAYGGSFTSIACGEAMFTGPLPGFVRLTQFEPGDFSRRQIPTWALHPGMDPSRPEGGLTRALGFLPGVQQGFGLRWRDAAPNGLDRNQLTGLAALLVGNPTGSFPQIDSPYFRGSMRLLTAVATNPKSFSLIETWSSDDHLSVRVTLGGPVTPPEPGSAIGRVEPLFVGSVEVQPDNVVTLGQLGPRPSTFREVTTERINLRHRDGPNGASGEIVITVSSSDVRSHQQIRETLLDPRTPGLAVLFRHTQPMIPQTGAPNPNRMIYFMAGPIHPDGDRNRYFVDIVIKLTPEQAASVQPPDSPATIVASIVEALANRLGLPTGSLGGPQLQVVRSNE